MKPQQTADAAFIGADRSAGQTCAKLEEAQLRQLDVNGSSASIAFEKVPYLSLYPSSSVHFGKAPTMTHLRQCWTSPSTAAVNDPLEKRTLCPWSWRTNVDRKRVPAVILEAQCDCDKFRLHGANRNGAAATVIEYGCERLTYRMRVIKFLDDQCQEYRIAYEEVAVACIPVKQPGRVVNDRQTPIHQHIDNMPRDY